MAIRLINTDTYCLEAFVGDRIPKYAILSHTWNDGELTLQEMRAISEDPGHPASRKPGYAKVIRTCQRSKEDGFLYTWVDSCCIDKTSSSELNEAINTMYRWYQQAEVCYALLSDLDTGGSDYAIETSLPKCRWFTRGWCLQELIAPRRIDFFDMHWNKIGSRMDLMSVISQITNIDEDLLVDNNRIDSVPVARRMSWAAMRVTTREEDMAYCLIGIFDVNMPMIYGEGSKAFMRLQEEIIKKSNDLSIFAFLNTPIDCEPVLDLGSDTIDDQSRQYCNLFATSPRDFMSCGTLAHTRNGAHSDSSFSITNRGLCFRRAELNIDVGHGSYSMSMSCELGDSIPVLMYLGKVGPGLYARLDPRLESYSRQSKRNTGLEGGDDNYTIQEEEVYIIMKLTPAVQLQISQAESYAVNISSTSRLICRAIQPIQRIPTSTRWDASRTQFLTRGDAVTAYCKVFPALATQRIPDSHGGNPNPTTQSFQDSFYLVYGIDGPETHGLGKKIPNRAWVRLYSVEEWRQLEKRLGIITNLDDWDVAYGNRSNHTSDQMIFKPTKLADPAIMTTVTATIDLYVENCSLPRYQLKLEFEEQLITPFVSASQPCDPGHRLQIS